MSSFGLMFFPRTADGVAGTASLMDGLGYDLLGLIDSHALAMDVYVALTLAATRPTRLCLGPCVTNPVIRLPFCPVRGRSREGSFSTSCSRSLSIRESRCGGPRVVESRRLSEVAAPLALRHGLAGGSPRLPHGEEVEQALGLVHGGRSE
jgi:hypothetical protein